jgi:hypothetical protein
VGWQVQDGRRDQIMMQEWLHPSVVKVAADLFDRSTRTTVKRDKIDSKTQARFVTDLVLWIERGKVSGTLETRLTALVRDYILPNKIKGAHKLHREQVKAIKGKMKSYKP